MADDDCPLFSQEGYDPTFRRQMQRLHHLTVVGRWSMTGLFWLCLAPISVWGLRAEIALWREYFTWAALRYGLIYNPLPTFGLSLCVGMTVAVLIWQSRNILFGVPQPQSKRLERQVIRIREQGPSHPLWKWVCEEK